MSLPVFDGLPPCENSWTAVEVDIGRSEIPEALAVAPGVVEVDELSKSRFQLSRQLVVFEQNAVLQ
jgi:hypothetical protein